MIKKMSRVMVLIVGMICVLVLLGNPASASAQDGVFIHISSGPENPHKVLMALHMADIMSKDKDVLVYLDIKGVEVVLKDSEDLRFSHFPSSKKAIAKLLEKGVTIYACPGCLKAMDKNPEDLIKGVEAADKDGFFSFTEGRILSLDY